MEWQFLYANEVDMLEEDPWEEHIVSAEDINSACDKMLSFIGDNDEDILIDYEVEVNGEFLDLRTIDHDIANYIA